MLCTRHTFYLVTFDFWPNDQATRTYKNRRSVQWALKSIYGAGSWRWVGKSVFIHGEFSGEWLKVATVEAVTRKDWAE